MLLTRVITAAVLLLILVVAAQAGDHVLNAVLAVGYGITLAEWLKLTKLSGTPSYLLGGCFALAGAGLALGAADLDVFGSAYLVLQLAVACIWLAVTAVCYNPRNIGFGVARPAATVLAFVVTTATWLAVWQFLRLGSWPLLISVFMIVWLADACAYFAGRLFGKNRMAPAISPKKTWEGRPCQCLGCCACRLPVAAARNGAHEHSARQGGFCCRFTDDSGSGGGFRFRRLI